MPGHPPGRAAGLVVQRGVQVPRPGGLVLERARVAAPFRGAFPGLPAHDLQRARKAQGLGFEQVVKVPAGLLAVTVAGLAVLAVARAGAALVVALADLLGPRAENDTAPSAFTEGSGRVGVHGGGLGDGCFHVGSGQLTELAAGDLAHQRVVEDKLGAEARLRAESREGQVQVLLAGLGLFRLDRGPAPLQPAAQALDGLRWPYQADRDGMRRGRGVRAGRPVHGDAVARVDVPVPGAELQFRLVQDVGLHDGRSHRPARRPRSPGSGASGSGGGIQARSSMAASASTVSRLPNRIRSSRLVNKVSSPCR